MQSSSPGRDDLCHAAGARASAVNCNWTGGHAAPSPYLYAVRDLQRIHHWQGPELMSSDGDATGDATGDANGDATSNATGTGTGRLRSSKGTVTVRPFSARTAAVSAARFLPGTGVGIGASAHTCEPASPGKPGLQDEKWVRKLKLKLKNNPAEPPEKDRHAEAGGAWGGGGGAWGAGGAQGQGGARGGGGGGEPELPCSLEDVRRMMAEPDKSVGYVVQMNSPRSVVLCLLTGIDPNTLVPRQIVPPRSNDPFSEYEILFLKP